MKTNLQSMNRFPAIIFALCLASSAAAENAPFNVRNYGAAGDGKTLDTAAIQKAVDACAASSGGAVILPAGRYLSGTIRLKSHVALQLDDGAILLGSPSLEDYPETSSSVRSYTDNYVRQSLIAGENLERVAIRGRGVIDGQGQLFRRKEYLTRPYVIRLVKCEDVLIEGVTLLNSPMWMQHYLACDRVRIQGIRVWNHASYNNDGLDIDGCHDVRISDCDFDSDDDALCLKSTLDRACENVVITNCRISSHCNAIKTGTESNGGFKNIVISNCAISSPARSKATYGAQRGYCGVALEIVDGGTLENVTISNIAIRGVGVPFFMRLGNRARPFVKNGPKPPVGVFRNVIVADIVATEVSSMGCSITGVPGHPIENVSIHDVRLSFDGGGRLEEASRKPPEKEASYPESGMFGALPAWGFYCRHVKDISFSNVSLRTAAPDLRHAIVGDDARDLRIEGMDASVSAGAAPLIRLCQVENAAISSCLPLGKIATFLKLEGERTSRIFLGPNIAAGAEQLTECAPEVSKQAIERAAP
ncbi:MAG: glycoside hydrolase family 28 protein [Candidatus Sumerlaeota bacterium]|nr:glycoside hydrolase family 28 protein [Candidatus Sumerlaeota bacterium]